MSAKKQFRRLVMATSLAVMGLSQAFNAAAQDAVTPAPIPAPVPIPVVIIPANGNAVPDTAQRISPQDAAIAAQLALIDKIIADNKDKDDFIPVRDTRIIAAVDEMLAQLNAGANPDFFPGKDGLKVMGANTMSAVQAAIVLGNAMNRPDLSLAFIEKSANLHKKSPDNWSVMDYAISSFIDAQNTSLSHAQSSALILRTLRDKGVALSEAEEMIKTSKGTLKNFNDLARGLTGIEALRRENLISQDEASLLANGDPVLKQIIQNTTTITADMIKKHGGTIVNYPETVPGAPEIYTVRAGDTLAVLAARLAPVLGMTSAKDAIKLIADANNIPLNRRGVPKQEIKEKDELLIPVPLGTQIGTVSPNGDASLLDLAEGIQHIYYRPNLTPEQIATEIALMNNLDPAKIKDETYIKKNQVVDFAMINNSHTQLPRLTAPARYKGGREVDLFVIEPQDNHGKNTYRVANGTAYSINPQVDLTQIHALSEMLLVDQPSGNSSDALRMLLGAEGSPVQDRVVFSHSMAIRFDFERKGDKLRNAQDHDSAMYENIRRYVDQLERHKPIEFNAAGNWWPGEGRYPPTHQQSHSPRSIIIGAVGQYPGNVLLEKKRIISAYSTHGADICSPLPMNLDRQMEGTSFSTPLTAALYRQMSEWYGDVLSFEEIMAAAMMTADRDVEDYTNVHGLGRSLKDAPDKFNTKPAEFRSNGGGLPNHERCGAGVLNLTRWQQALDMLVTLKETPSLHGTAAAVQKDGGNSFTLPVSAPQIILPKNADMRAEYVYRVTVPQNMTVGKLTFLLPQYQGAYSEIVVRTPGGFEKHLGKSLNGVLSTFAFAYEDVKAGDVFEIRSNKPLGPTAGMVLRGHNPGNAISLLRDHLRARNLLPAPNMTMSGNTIIGVNAPLNVLQAPPKPETPATKTEAPPPPTENGSNPDSMPSIPASLTPTEMPVSKDASKRPFLNGPRP